MPIFAELQLCALLNTKKIHCKEGIHFGDCEDEGEDTNCPVRSPPSLLNTKPMLSSSIMPLGVMKVYRTTIVEMIGNRFGIFEFFTSPS